MGNTAPPRRLPHRAWIVAFAAAIAVFCGLGLGRFAFGMMLPPMSASLGLDYAQGGLLGSFNMIGYLISVPTAPFVLRRVGTRATTTFGLGLMVLSMLGLTVTENFARLCLLYLLTGIGSGCVVLPTMSVMSQWFAPSHRGLAAGIVMTGPGFGIILSGFIVPNLAPMGGFQAWQGGWLIFAGITGAVAVLAYALIRNHPGDLGLAPVGRAPVAPAIKPPAITRRARVHLLGLLGVIYGIYGATYMTYVTFIVTSMIDGYGMTQQAAGGLWAWFGLLSIFSGVLFGWLSDRIGRRKGMAAAFGVLATAYLLVGFGPWMPGLYASILLFGVAAWSIPVIMAAASGDFFGPAAAANALAILMVIFSIGQGIGPAVAGFLAEHSGTFSTSYAGAGLAAIAALGLTFALRPPHTVD